jgi:hypothetical protein
VTSCSLSFVRVYDSYIRRIPTRLSDRAVVEIVLGSCSLKKDNWYGVRTIDVPPVPVSTRALSPPPIYTSWTDDSARTPDSARLYGISFRTQGNSQLSSFLAFTVQENYISPSASVCSPAFCWGLRLLGTIKNHDASTSVTLQQKVLRDGESNPGLPRDRRGY